MEQELNFRIILESPAKDGQPELRDSETFWWLESDEVVTRRLLRAFESSFEIDWLQTRGPVFDCGSIWLRRLLICTARGLA